jgi:hypothetical protein
MFKFLNKRNLYSILVLLGILLLALSFSKISHYEGATGEINDIATEIKTAAADVKNTQHILIGKRQKLQKLQRAQAQAAAQAKAKAAAAKAATPAKAQTTAPVTAAKPATTTTAPATTTTAPVTATTPSTAVRN